jgi:hypothetical protein
MAELLLCFKKHAVPGIPHDQRIPGCHAFARHFVKHIPGRRHVPALGVDVHQAGANLVAHACTWWPQVGGRHAQAAEMMCGLGRNPQREHEKSVNARPGWGCTRSEMSSASVSVYKETSYVRRTRHTEMSTWAWSCLARHAEIGKRRAMTIVVSARRS